MAAHSSSDFWRSAAGTLLRSLQGDLCSGGAPACLEAQFGEDLFAEDVALGDRQQPSSTSASEECRLGQVGGVPDQYALIAVIAKPLE